MVILHVHVDSIASNVAWCGAKRRNGEDRARCSVHVGNDPPGIGVNPSGFGLIPHLLEYSLNRHTVRPHYIWCGDNRPRAKSEASYTIFSPHRTPSESSISSYFQQRTRIACGKD